VTCGSKLMFLLIHKNKMQPIKNFKYRWAIVKGLWNMISYILENIKAFPAETQSQTWGLHERAYQKWLQYFCLLSIWVHKVTFQTMTCLVLKLYIYDSPIEITWDIVYWGLFSFHCPPKSLKTSNRSCLFFFLIFLCRYKEL
jgi:hypothetical protein